MFNSIKSLLGRNPEPINANVEIYTLQTCPFCLRAKKLLKKKGVKFTEYKIDGDDNARTQMIERTKGRRTVPQVFINNQYIGGCDDLYRLDSQSKLNPLLSQPAQAEDS